MAQPVPSPAWWRSSRYQRVALAVLAALVLTGAYVAGWLTPRLGAPNDTSAEAGFARDMSTHHAQAVEMAMFAYTNSADSELRIIGYDMALTQQNQIGTMQTWLRTWRLQPTGSQARMAWMPGEVHLNADGTMPGMASTAQLDQLRAATGTAFDVLFCQLMLRHHLGGIHMADAVLQLSHDPQVVDLATAIKRNQQGEVTLLQDKLNHLGAKPLTN